MQDEAKKFVLLAEAGGIDLDNQKVRAILKNDLDHKHFDLEYLIARTKHEAETMKYQQDIAIAEKLVKYYEDNMHKELPGYHNLLKFRNASISLFDPEQTIRPLPNPTSADREETLQKIKELEKKYPVLDFGPLYVSLLLMRICNRLLKNLLMLEFQNIRKLLKHIRKID